MRWTATRRRPMEQQPSGSVRVQNVRATTKTRMARARGKYTESSPILSRNRKLDRAVVTCAVRASAARRSVCRAGSRFRQNQYVGFVCNVRRYGSSLRPLHVVFTSCRYCPLHWTLHTQHPKETDVVFRTCARILFYVHGRTFKHNSFQNWYPR